MKASVKKFISAIMAIAMVLSGLYIQGAEEKIVVLAEENALSNPRIVTDSSMKAGQKVTWDCVWFGSYPQSEVVSTDSMYTILQSATGWDSNGDIVIGTEKYRRIKKEDAVSKMSTYNWDEQFHYFKYEPIKWRVLSVDETTLFLLSDKILDDQSYNLVQNGYKNIYVTWATSTIRSWLNGYNDAQNAFGKNYTEKNFEKTAFSENEYNAIYTSSVENSDNLSGGVEEGGNATNDKLFLLSESEAYIDAATYGFVLNRATYDEARQAKGSNYAQAMGLWVSETPDYLDNSSWWLRSPESDSRYAANIGFMGKVDGNFMHEGMRAGVRPALNLNLSATDLYKYAGTVCSDGTINEVPLSTQTPEATPSVNPSAPTVTNATPSIEPSATTIPTTTSTYNSGDVDQNGSVDLTDVQMILQFYLDVRPVPNDEIFALADVNHDGSVDLQDVQMVLQAYLGLITLDGTISSASPSNSQAPQSSENVITGDYKSAYKEFLLSYPRNTGTEKPKFIFDYVDEDDIPELFIVSTSNSSSTDIYTYRNGSVVKINEQSYWLADNYYSFIPKKNLFQWVDSQDGDDSYKLNHSYYSLKQGKLMCTDQFEFVYKDDQATYRYNGQNVTEQSYNTKLTEIKLTIDKDGISYEYNKCYDITEANIDKLLAVFESSSNEIISDQEANVNWKELYQQFLLSYMKDSDHSDHKFSLEYIDEDETPELVIYLFNGGAYEVYTIYENQVCDVGTWSGYGDFRYVPKGNLIVSSTLRRGYSNTGFSKIENGESKLEHHFYDNYESGETPVEYKYNDVLITQEEYQEKMNALFQKCVIKTSSDFSEITTSNIAAQFK